VRKVLKVREVRKMLKVLLYDQNGFEVNEFLGDFYAFFFAVLLVESVESLRNRIPVFFVNSMFFHIGVNKRGSFLLSA